MSRAPLGETAAGTGPPATSAPPLEPFTFVVFGATGDLARRKLLPALYRLSREGRLPRMNVLGVARTPLDDLGFRELVRDTWEAVEPGQQDEFKKWSHDMVRYQHSGEDQSAAFTGIAQRIAELERASSSPQNRVLYLAVPPAAVPELVERIATCGLNRSSGWTRVVLEKPFGEDLDSALHLQQQLLAHFDESQIFRIDHYLGKETVQNLLVFRFANRVFEPLWCSKHIAAVRITVAESLGVEQRGEYYDRTGALRDMVQNHVTQLLTLIAMEPPRTLAADDVRDAKVAVLHAASVDLDSVVLGQYDAYAAEPGVRPESRTETYVSLRVDIENDRWRGVPFTLATGKRLAERRSVIELEFGPSVTAPMAAGVAVMPRDGVVNELDIHIQPDEGFDLSFAVKAPGRSGEITEQPLRFRYSDAFAERIPDAYETLLLEVVEGDQTLFVRSDWLEASWRLYDPVPSARLPVRPYPAGSDGPV